MYFLRFEFLFLRTWLRMWLQFILIRGCNEMFLFSNEWYKSNNWEKVRIMFHWSIKNFQFSNRMETDILDQDVMSKCVADLFFHSVKLVMLLTSVMLAANFDRLLDYISNLCFAKPWLTTLWTVVIQFICVHVFFRSSVSVIVILIGIEIIDIKIQRALRWITSLDKSS